MAIESHKKSNWISLLETIRLAFGIPFMVLFGFKLGHLGHLNKSLGDLFFNTHAWLYSWLGVLCTVSIALDARQLWLMKKELDAITKEAEAEETTAPYSEIYMPDLHPLTNRSNTAELRDEVAKKAKAYRDFRYRFIFNTLGMAVGSAFFIAYLHLGAPTTGGVAALVQVAKVVLLVAFSFDFIQKLTDMLSGDAFQATENGSKNRATIGLRELISFSNKGLSLATLVILFWYAEGLSATLVTALSCTCTALAFIEAVIIPRVFDRGAPPSKRIYSESRRASFGDSDDLENTPNSSRISHGLMELDKKGTLKPNNSISLVFDKKQSWEQPSPFTTLGRAICGFFGCNQTKSKVSLLVGLGKDDDENQNYNYDQDGNPLPLVFDGGGVGKSNC